MNEVVWLDSNTAARIADEGTTAYRVCSADDGWIERFGTTALISLKNPDDQHDLLDELDRWSGETDVALDRIYLRHLVRQPREKDAPILLRGDESRSTLETVLESGLQYEVDFSAGYSVGLFCDQRANRIYLRDLAPGRLLNTFAYTCAFSVVAATVGTATLSVDLSKSSLNRGRHNFELNNLDLANHRFIADDVLEFLPRLERRGEKFDAIILDPPTFGRGPKRSFRADRDFEDLLESAMKCATPDAAILLSTNCTSLDAHALRKIASRVAKGRVEFHQEPALPDIPSRHAASTVWMRLGKKGRRQPTRNKR